MLEKNIEKRLVDAVKGAKGVSIKMVCTGFNGMPDRLLLFPGGRLAFVEVKAPGEKPRALQLKRHGMLRRLGFKVYVLDDVVQIKQILKDVGGDAK